MDLDESALVVVIRAFIETLSGFVMRSGFRIVALMLIGLSLSGCSSVNTWLAEKTADNLPASMGGLPADAPPRPSDPRSEEYERAQLGKTETEKK